MTYVIDVDAEGVRVPLSRRRAADAARSVLRSEKIDDARLSIAFVDNRRIAQINRRHLGHRGPTDVISFALTSGAQSGPVVGDIYIAPDVARRNAAAHGVPVREELTRLVIHGVLHVIGFDHPEGDDRETSAMWRKQERLVAKLRRGTASRGRSTRGSKVAA